ncbi:hypothetical protein SAMN05216328_1842 [Ensifer sp. YR511]|nr:hypothetical protein SAMN05216328_1842 [Ensifer sp. YR511]
MGDLCAFVFDEPCTAILCDVRANLYSCAKSVVPVDQQDNVCGVGRRGRAS